MVDFEIVNLDKDIGTVSANSVMVVFFLFAWVGENVRTADRETGRLTVKRLPFGQVNERE